MSQESKFLFLLYLNSLDMQILISVNECRRKIREGKKGLGESHWKR